MQNRKKGTRREQMTETSAGKGGGGSRGTDGMEKINGGGTFGKCGNNVGAFELHQENAEAAHVGIASWGLA